MHYTCTLCSCKWKHMWASEAIIFPVYILYPGGIFPLQSKAQRLFIFVRNRCIMRTGIYSSGILFLHLSNGEKHFHRGYSHIFCSCTDILPHTFSAYLRRKGQGYYAQYFSVNNYTVHICIVCRIHLLSPCFAAVWISSSIILTAAAGKFSFYCLFCACLSFLFMV